MAEKTREGAPILTFANQHQRFTPLIRTAACRDVPFPVTVRRRSGTCVFFVCHKKGQTIIPVGQDTPSGNALIPHSTAYFPEI